MLPWMLQHRHWTCGPPWRGAHQPLATPGAFLPQCHTSDSYTLDATADADMLSSFTEANSRSRETEVTYFKQGGVRQVERALHEQAAVLAAPLPPVCAGLALAAPRAHVPHRSQHLLCGGVHCLSKPHIS